MKKIDNLKLTTATVGALLALISAGCAEKNKNKENKVKETTGVTTTLGTTETTQTTTYTQTLKTTGVKVTTLPTTTAKVVTTTLAPKYTQELTSKETYSTNVEVATLPTTTTEQPLETTVSTETTVVTEEQPLETTTEMSNRVTLEQLNYAYEYLSENDVKSYARMITAQEVVAITHYYKPDGSLTNEIEKNFDVKLSEQDKERYDTLFEKTSKAYEECEYLYETLDVENANKLFEELISNEEYLNIKDIIKVCAYAINGYMKCELITDPTKYIIEDNSIIFHNGIKMCNAFPATNETDVYEPFTVMNHFGVQSEDTTDEKEFMQSYGVSWLLPNLIRNLRVGMDTETSAYYIFTQQGLVNEYDKFFKNIFDTYGVVSWESEYMLDERGNKNPIYFVYDENKVKYVCSTNSELYEMISCCDLLGTALRKADENKNFEYNFSELNEMIKLNKEKNIQKRIK